MSRRVTIRRRLRLLAVLLVLGASVAACLPLAPGGPPRGGSGGSASTNRWSVGVYKGSLRPEAVRAHEEWLGRSVGTVLEIIPRDTWAQISKPVTQIRTWKPHPYEVVFTTAMLPKSGGTLAAGARGEYDAHWRTFASTFVAEGRPNAIIRLGHEFNHTWYPWTATGGKEADFAAYFRRIVDVTRSVSGARLRFTWNVLAGAAGADVEKAYPGDAHVDHIGLDIYDGIWNTPDFDERWRTLRTQRYGIDWLLTFATKHGKPMAFDEWALVKASSPSCRDPRGDSGDDTVFINRMIDFFETERVAYAIYFDVETTYGCTNSRIMNGPYPNATATYRRRVLATGSASAVTTTTRPATTTTTSTTRPPATTTTTRAPVTTTTTRPPSTTTTLLPSLPRLPLSDEFSGSALDRSRWTYVNPSVDSNPWVGAGDLTLVAMAGRPHDVRPEGDASVRVTQPAGGADFVVDVRFTSTPTAAGTWQGITAAVGGATVRYAVRSVGGDLRAVGDVIDAAGRVAVTDRAVPRAPAGWVLRLERRGDTFAMSWSLDGLLFADRVTTTVAGAVTAVGPAAGNAAAGAPPARHDAWIDYVRFSAA